MSQGVKGEDSGPDRFHANLLAPPVAPDVADQVGRELLDVLRDPAQPIETKRCAAYYLAQVHEYRGEWDGMADMLHFSGVPVGRDHDESYDWLAHHGWAHVFRRQQDAAIARGIPAIHINSMPQSGSSFLNAFLTTALDIDRCRTTKGPDGSARIVPAWLSTLARGGATTHEHFIASPHNIRALEASGISTLWVHVRHPAAAMLSDYRLQKDDTEMRFVLNRMKAPYSPADLRDPDRGLRNFADVFLRDRVRFLDTWMNYGLQPTAKVKVFFSRYEDQVVDPPAFYNRLLSVFLGDDHGIDVGGIVARMQREAAATGAFNFRGGQSNKLLDSCDDLTRDFIASIIPQDLLRFFGY